VALGSEFPGGKTVILLDLLVT